MSDVKPRRGRKRAAADPQTPLPSAGTGVEESAGAIATVKKEPKEEDEETGKEMLGLGRVAWRALKVAPEELRIDVTLACGQSFRWRKTGPAEWTSVLAGRVIALQQTDDDVLYRVVASAPPGAAVAAADADAGVRAILADYFRLDVSLAQLYGEWSTADPTFRQHAASFRGIRMLRQDPVENVFTFICSSCNNIARITQMVDKLCERYGEPVGAYHAFPTIARLAADDVEADLRALGFGYRARYIQQAAQLIMRERSAEWLASLRTVPYAEARANVIALPGVGPKVADCVCLMSLDKLEAIPVDTHVWQIAVRDYGLDLQGKSLTPRIYQSIGDHFRRLYGARAGWAHSVLFAADLKRFEGRRADGSSPVKVKRLRKMDLAAASL